MTKDAILSAIRRGLRRGPLPVDQRAMLDGRLATHPRHPIPARAKGTRAALLARFVANVEKEFGTVERVPDAAAIPGAVADYLAAANLAPSFVTAPHPALRSLPWSDRPMLAFEARRAAPDDAVSVQHAWAGVAETGTLLFPSDPTRPATLNLLPETKIAVIRASDVVGAFEETWDRLRTTRTGEEPSGGFMPRNLMLVTGPSRSADIEQTLELGAHGPRRLHVILVDDDPAGMPAGMTEETDAVAAPAVPPPPGRDAPDLAPDLATDAALPDPAPAAPVPGGTVPASVALDPDAGSGGLVTPSGPLPDPAAGPGGGPAPGPGARPPGG